MWEEELKLPDVQLNIRHWETQKNAPKIFLLHGWMDASISWQFVVENLKKDYHLIAPDWRGFGKSQWLSRPYPFLEHLGDLDLILNHYSPDEPALLVGHSLGGMLSCTYAGLKPERVKKLITLEGFGLAQKPPEVVRPLLQNWLGNRLNPPKMRVYEDESSFQRALLSKNPRLTEERAAFLAKNLCKKTEGGVVFNADPWHKARLPQRFPTEEVKFIWRFVKASVLWVSANNSWVMEEFKTAQEDYYSRVCAFLHLTTANIEHCGHMLHHDQPESVAGLMDSFLL